MKTSRPAKKKLPADYCSWIVVEYPSQRIAKDESLSVRGDIVGPLRRSASRKKFTGWFELPAKGEEAGFYEIVAIGPSGMRVLTRIDIEYTFDKFYFSPRWENVNAINAYLVDRYAPFVEREILHRYASVRRDIQLLKITDPSVPVTRKQILFITARIHNPESGTTASLYRFIRWLLDGDGREFLREYLFLMIPMTIPLTFEEDPRGHAVNREWRDDMFEPDLLAVRDKVLDRYAPEAWIDCHTFNAEMDLADKKTMRTQHADYIVAHTPDEEPFDRDYTRAIAHRLIAAAEKHGHIHRHRDYFVNWERTFNAGPFVQPREKIKTEFDPVGIFSGRDYARYADRDPYGLTGRTWPAMACDYGYARCHAVNMCLESKPLHVYWGTGPYHYPRRFSDSSVVKLQELCRLGREHFAGHAKPGLPCNAIVSDPFQKPSSVTLCAWGNDRQQTRQSRATLWRHRRSIQLNRDIKNRSTNSCRVTVFCVRSIESIPAAVRFMLPKQVASAAVTIDGKPCRRMQIIGSYVFVPIRVSQGKKQITVSW
jgi:hypothetical protein